METEFRLEDLFGDTNADSQDCIWISDSNQISTTRILEITVEQLTPIVGILDNYDVNGAKEAIEQLICHAQQTIEKINGAE
jgi:hypothetical protein